MCARLSFLLLLVCLSAQTFGQLTIDFPVNNAIFQRNKDSTAHLTITGTYTDQTTTAIAARLVSPLNGQAISGFDWMVLDTLPQLGHYRLVMKDIPGGWYTLQVRTLNNNVPLDLTTVDRVGVGEVFTVAGQSNAQGFQNLGSVSAQSEKVRTHSYNFYAGQNNSFNYYKKPTFPTSYIPLEYNSYLSTRGESSWAYGKLGDLLTTRLGVPVMFMNGAFEGTSTLNWKQGSDNQVTYSSYNSSAYYEPVGSPYLHYKTVLNYHAYQLGTRATLWHQGETDTFMGISTTSYRDNLLHVIDKSRSDFNKDLSWVICRVSFNGSIYSSAVIGGQNQTVQNSLNTFYGPNTDGIGNRNPAPGDYVHFHQSSLIDLANAWDSYLNGTFIEDSNPVAAMPVQPVALKQVSGQVEMTPPLGFTGYRWIDVTDGNKDYEKTPVATTRSITKTTGKYLCYLIESNGNIGVSQIVDAGIAQQFFATNPPACATYDYVSDLSPTAFTGEMYNDRSYEGKVIKLNDITYYKGVGVHTASIAWQPTPSMIEYDLTGKNYQRFVADVGMDDAVSTNNCPSTDGVVFKVYVGSNLTTPVFDSGVMLPETPTAHVDVSVAGETLLKLVVEPRTQINCDHSDWANARLTYNVAAPAVAIDKKYVNSGQSVSLSVTSGCNAPSTVRWSNGSTQNPVTITPTIENTYFATCVNNGCQSPRSTPVTFSFIPDCTLYYTLTSPDYLINGPQNLLTFRVSDYIHASNKVQNGAEVTFDAAKSILLTPGFTAENGTIFTAKIGGCAN